VTVTTEAAVRKEKNGMQNEIVSKKLTVTKVMIALNVIVFLVLEAIGNTQDAEFMLKWGAVYAPNIMQQHEYYRLLTSIFLHFGPEHLFNNMLLLLFLGETLEQEIGSAKFLYIYLGSGIFANIVSLWADIQSGTDVVSAGASGAIYGVIGAILFIVLVNKGQLEYITLRRLLFMIVLSLYYGFSSTGVDNVAHVSGLLIGFVLSLSVYRRKKRGHRVDFP
jgi:rhomboid protease GluP